VSMPEPGREKQDFILVDKQVATILKPVQHLSYKWSGKLYNRYKLPYCPNGGLPELGISSVGMGHCPIVRVNRSPVWISPSTLGWGSLLADLGHRVLFFRHICLFKIFSIPWKEAADRLNFIPWIPKFPPSGIGSFLGPPS